MVRAEHVQKKACRIANGGPGQGAGDESQGGSETEERAVDHGRERRSQQTTSGARKQSCLHIFLLAPSSPIRRGNAIDLQLQMAAEIRLGAA